jgi:hypothetical protein
MVKEGECAAKQAEEGQGERGRLVRVNRLLMESEPKRVQYFKRAAEKARAEREKKR